MARARIAALSLAALLATAEAHAEDFYVAPDGDDDNAGSLDEPFSTVERAQAEASAGDTVLIRGGVYAFSGASDTIGVAFTKSGVPDQPIRYFAYPGETPIFDLFELLPNARVTGLDISCDWIHIRGLEVRGTQQVIVGDSWGVRIRGDNNVIEHLNVHDNEAPGIFISSGADNLVLNCDSHHNYDPLEDGGNADGFGCHSTGSGNVLRGCRAWENSDDGYDFINAAGACTVEESWSFRNGWVPDTDTPAANGAGFKAGGYGSPPNTPAGGAAHHVVRFNVAFGNRVSGFYANHHPGEIDFFNNTAFDNPRNFDMLTEGPASLTLRNNLAAGTGAEIDRFTNGNDDINSWTLPVTVSNDDFVSLDKAQALAPRDADGRLPATMTTARLREDSDLIDKGEDLGFPFAGTAPDLGAFEHGLAPPVEPEDAGIPDASVAIDAGSAGTGGAGGVGGAGGIGGAAGAMVPPAGTVDAGFMQPQPGGMSAGTVAGAGGTMASQLTDRVVTSSGCGCRVAAHRTSLSAPTLLLLAIGVLGSMRGRRRARHR